MAGELRNRSPRKQRAVHGLLLLDKPHGCSSNQALQAVKSLYQARKAGHTGNLDPLATGLLPICMGEATKLSAYLLDADKRYWVRCQLGRTTTTGDAEGELLAQRAVPALTETIVRAVLDRFVGDLEQVPPMYSAVRHAGQRLYELARQGVTVERQPRSVHIFSLTLAAMAADTIDLAVHCSKGTYVRTLVEEIGAALDCGAHVAALCRLAVGPFMQAEMVSMDTLRAQAEQGLAALDSLLLPAETALRQWPRIAVNTDLAHYLKQGHPVLVPRAPTQGYVQLHLQDGGFFGVGEILDDGRVAPRRLLDLRV